MLWRIKLAWMSSDVVKSSSLNICELPGVTLAHCTENFSLNVRLLWSFYSVILRPTSTKLHARGCSLSLWSWGDRDCSRRATVGLGIDTLIANTLVKYCLLFCDTTCSGKWRQSYIWFSMSLRGLRPLRILSHQTSLWIITHRRGSTGAG